MTNLQMNVQTLKFPDADNKVNYSASHTAAAPGGLLAMTAALVLTSVMLTACGGGGNDGASSGSTASTISAQPGTPVSASAPVVVSTPTVTTGITPTGPATVFKPAAVLPVGGVITDIEVQNLGAAQTSVPFTFGQIFAVGDLLPTQGLVAKLANGTVLRLQTDVKATHPDGSVRHAIISGILPTLAAGQLSTLQLAKSSVTEAGTATPKSLVDGGLAGDVEITLDNVKYTAALGNALTTGTPIQWLSGPIANEWIVDAPLRTAAGAVHPQLSARFAVRAYPGVAKQARVEVVIENNKTFTPGAQNYTYDVNIGLAGRTTYTQDNLTHYHHARWRKLAWWDAAREPGIHLKHNSAYLIASKAVSNYDQSIVPAESELASYATKLTPALQAPMAIGPLVSSMGTTGGRGDIGPLPVWSVMYLLSMDKRAKDMMLAVAEGAGSWSIHYRDEATGFPVRTDNEVNKRISTHMNLASKGPLPVPRCANNNNALCVSPYKPDTAHQPSMAYLPYLVTGDYYYLEELHFWAAQNPLETDPNNSGLGLGLVRWQQLRGQAWSMRTLGHAAYITPDTHALKGYFTKQLDNNLNYYHDMFVTANPNQLGAYDGSGPGAHEEPSSAPWQDDFFTWSLGYLNELGFTKAKPIHEWKAKYAVGRMTAPGFCWIGGAAYTMKFRDDTTKQMFSSFAQLYAENFSNSSIRLDSGAFMNPAAGLASFLDLPCGSAAQALWLTAVTGKGWAQGQMVGYSSSDMGYPSNMQPALAVAVGSGTPNASAAWTTFAGRAAKPNYSKAPQWDIIPR
jgi:hypothetical protein